MHPAGPSAFTPIPFAAFQAEILPEATPQRAAITTAYRRDEVSAVQWLLQQVRPSSTETTAEGQALAHRLVSNVRHKRTRASGVDALMHEFSLSSEEGVALMCLAEALLRIPDSPTADRLIADKISKGDWKKHLGESPSLFVNAATWGLLITGKLVSTSSESGLGSAMTKLIAKGGEPLIRKGVDLAMRMLGNQFVTGQTIEEALKNSRENETRGYRYSYDMLGEAALTQQDAANYYASYETAIHAIGKASNGRGIRNGPGISVKLSALHARYSRAQRARVMEELLPKVKALLLLAKQYNIGFNIDAEETDRLELSLDLMEALAFDADLAGFDGIGYVVQAYQKRCPFAIDFLVDLAHRSGRKFMVRLVKGAYWDAEVKRAQVDGQEGYPVYTRKVYTDVSYLVCAQKLLAASSLIYPQFATHNAQTLATIYTWAKRDGISDYEFQCLHGMGETLYDQVVGPDNLDKPCRIYAPVGSHETLLAYLVRRLLENGANSSFVHQLADESVGMDVLLTSPLRLAPQPSLPLPPELYGPSRANSQGLDLTVLSMRAPLLAALADVQVPVVPEFDAKLVAGPLSISVSSYQKWSKSEVAERAAILRRAADALQQQMPRFCALLVQEAFKTWGDAVSEVREAIDFLRYYANEAERIMQPIAMPGQSQGVTHGVTGETNTLRLTARGPWVCISPWNFPLAIFVGQVAAALGTGNTVLAKPAEQTPGVAWEAVKLLHAAGVPEGALQLLHGPGETVGAALVAAPGVAGVVFTGSTQVAQIINRALAAKDGPITPLIAETGGINAMLVDSSALPEQVVDAVVQSAFRSAGQRCSALRLLCLHEGIADKVIEMIQGAVQELKVGNPADLATDVGPVIDREAFDNIQRHLQRLSSTSKVLPAHIPPAQAAPDSIANLIYPEAFEVATLAEVKDEIFGPVLQIVRWRGDPAAVIAQINALGYGLTLGIQTRIDSRAQALAAAAHVGNIYINRNMIGAVVGVQPFGGEGLSGTGPKAGGPHYLYRFCTEQTVTVNTTAAGGNATLLAGGH